MRVNASSAPSGSSNAQHPRPAHQRAGKCHTLLLSAREDRRPFGAPVLEANLVQRRKRSFPCVDRPAVGAEPDLDVSEHTRPREQPRLLKHDPNRICIRLPFGSLSEPQLSTGGPIEADQQPKQSALAAAAAADHGHELARTDVKIDAVEHLLPPEGFSEPANVDR
jgi:hypothetical protein